MFWKTVPVDLSCKVIYHSLTSLDSCSTAVAMDINASAQLSKVGL